MKKKPQPKSNWLELAWLNNEPVAYINEETGEIRQLNNDKWEISWGAPGLGWFYSEVTHPLQESN